ncbi:hypothetical protein C0J52_28087 [Blattella germanica]|nr:hypothetical protein C0J52_28087 [Blattella germanica]
MTFDRAMPNQPTVKLRRFLSEGHHQRQDSPSASRQRSATVTFNRCIVKDLNMTLVRQQCILTRSRKNNSSWKQMRVMQMSSVGILGARIVV